MIGPAWQFSAPGNYNYTPILDWCSYSNISCWYCRFILDDATETIGRAYFPLLLAKALTIGIVKEACKAEGISIPPKAGKNALLTHLSKELFLANKARLKTTNDKITRDDVILVK